MYVRTYTYIYTLLASRRLDLSPKFAIEKGHSPPDIFFFCKAKTRPSGLKFPKQLRIIVISNLYLKSARNFSVYRSLGP